MIIVSRDQLHKEVWEEPMTKVAERYGISDVALKKICDKHRIPTPPRGYWAKLAAGKKVKKTHFRSLTDPEINNIRIYGAPGHMSEEIAKKVKQVEQDAKLAKRKVTKHKAAEVTGDLHPKAQQLKERLLKATPDEKGLISLQQKSSISLSIGAASIERVSKIYHLLLVQGEKAGVRFVQGERHQVFDVDGEQLAFSITEGLGKEKHTMTEAEAKALEKWEKKNEREHRRNDFDAMFSFGWGRPKIPEFDYYPSGSLAFEFSEHGYTGIRRKFADGKTQTIEKLLDSILITARKHVAARIAKHLEDEERKMEWAEEERRRKEAKILHNLEKKRVGVLADIFEKWQQSKDLKVFLSEARELAFKLG